MTNGKKNGRAYSPPKYRTVKYKGERDESMDDVYSIAQNEGLSNTQIHVMSGVSMSTLNNWWNPRAKKRTKRPTHIALRAVLGAMGWDYAPVRRRQIDVDKEMAAGQRWLDQRRREQGKE